MRLQTLTLLAAMALAPLHSDEVEAVSRIHAHLLIGDPQGALAEAAGALSEAKDSPQLWEAYIGALAAGKDIKGMLKAWGRYTPLVADPYKNRQLIEKMAWGVIASSYHSSSPVIRVTSLIAAHIGNDARGIEILSMGLCDSNSFIRATTLQIAAQTRDAKLCSAVVDLFKKEKISFVRWEAVRAMGKMKLFAMKPELLALLADERTEDEGKAAAIEAIVNMEEAIACEELVALTKSPRAGLRHLACEVVNGLDLVEELSYIEPLLNDVQSAVRSSALRAIALLRPETGAGESAIALITPLLADPDPKVAITAAWAALLHDRALGQRHLERWLSEDRKEERLFAAGALAAAGEHGYPLTLEAFRSNSDPYIKLTLALAMLAQRSHIEEACAVIRRQLLTNRDRWMWKEEGGFRMIARSKIKHNPAIPHYPEAVSQMVRLELLNALAIVGDVHAQEAIAAFLGEKGWGISATASALLLSEGDESAADLVQGLLEDKNRSVRMQAALVLAFWGRGEVAVRRLEESYAVTDREFKERILEGIGRVGLQSSLPFLVDKLGEPYPTLRLIAAAALLQCLNQ